MLVLVGLQSNTFLTHCKQLGAAIIGFIKLKSGAFPKATLSQRHFNLVPTWKRANICIRLLSHILEVHCNHHWYNFTYASYKFIVGVFEAYCVADEKIWGVCNLYDTMPKDVITAGKRTPPRKKRTRDMFEVATPDMLKEPEEVVCLITTSESEEEEAAAPAAKQSKAGKT